MQNWCRSIPDHNSWCTFFLKIRYNFCITNETKTYLNMKLRARKSKLTRAYGRHITTLRRYRIIRLHVVRAHRKEHLQIHFKKIFFDVNLIFLPVLNGKRANNSCKRKSYLNYYCCFFFTILHTYYALGILS